MLDCPQTVPNTCMPTLTKRSNGSWQVKVRLANYPAESQVFDTKARASAWGYAREAELKNKAKSLVKATLQDAVDKYISDVCPTHKSGDNEAKRLKALSKIKDLLPMSKPVSDVTASDLSRFRDIRLGSVSVASVRKEMTIVRSVLEAARRDWGMLNVNPIQDVKKPPAPPDRKRLFTDKETEAILLALNYHGEVTTRQHQVAVALLLAFETGMRAGEMLGLTWGVVNIPGRFVTLPVTKNGDQRDVPLSSKAIDLINKLKGLDKTNVFTIKAAYLDSLFRKAKDACKIENLHFHDSRANAITRLSHKMDVRDLAVMIGHRDLNNLMIYYRKTASDIATLLD